MCGVIFLGVAGALAFGVPALLFAWARWLNGKAIAPRVVRRTAFALLAVAALSWLRVFAAPWTNYVAGVDIDDWHRRRILAEDFSSAIRTYVELSLLIELVAAFSLLFATWRYHWLARAPNVPRDPPYR